MSNPLHETPEVPIEVPIADWNEWSPKDYIAEYYETVIPDCRYAMEWVVHNVKTLEPVDVGD